MSSISDNISPTGVNQDDSNSLEDLLKQELVTQAEFLLHELVTSADNSLTTAKLGAISKILNNLKGIAQLTQMDLLADFIIWLAQQVDRLQSDLIRQGNQVPLTTIPSDHSLIVGLHWLQQISRVPSAEMRMWLEQNYAAMQTIMTQNNPNLREVSPAVSHPIPISDTFVATVPEVIPVKDSPVLSSQSESQHLTAAPNSTMVDVAGIDRDPAMVELFRLEVEEQSKILNQVLLTLEEQQHSPQALEALMRAAHSIKGAARIVSLDMAVQLAHSMEDAFVAAQNQQITLTADDIDILLHAVDLLSGISQRESQNLGTWLNSQSPNFETTLGYISTMTQANAQANLKGSIIAQNSSQSAPDTTSSLIAPVSHNISSNVATSNVIPEITQAVSEAPIPTTVKVTTVLHEKAPEKAHDLAHNKDRVVRVSAENLNRIMGLAGESLIEANWLSPYADSLLILKKRQLELAKLWGNLKHNLGTPQTENYHTIIEAINQKERECREILADRLTELELFARRTGNLSDRLYREVIASHMRPFEDGVQSFPRMVRDVARRLGKQVHLEIVGKATPVDRDILTKLEAPLTHILRNGVDHGIEMPTERLAQGKPTEGKIRLEAMHRGGMLSITITDDGKGIDLDWLRQKIVSKNLSPLEMVAQMNEAELLEFLFLPGFSTAAAVTEISGRGVGLDIAKSMADQVGGTVRVSTQVGKGTVFHFQLPLTLSVVRTLLVEIAGEPYAFPLARIEQIVMVQQSEIASMENRQYFTMNGRHIGLISAAQVLELREDPVQNPADLAVV
ncbi:MAG: chemotaxis protein CheA, partial [Pseudanabaena sp. ELA607]